MYNFCAGQESLKDQMAFYLYNKKQSDHCFDHRLLDVASETHVVETDLFSEQMHAIEKLLGNAFVLEEDTPPVSDLSKCILVLSKKYLDVAPDWHAQKNAIALACFAWNLSLLYPCNRIKILIETWNGFLNKEEFKALRNSRRTHLLMSEKIWKYPLMECFITGFELIQSRGGFYLQVNATVCNLDLQPYSSGIINDMYFGYERTQKKFSVFLSRTLSYPKRAVSNLLGL